VWGGSAAAAALDDIRAACRAHDGQDPLNEAAELSLKQQGLLSGARLWIGDGSRGFALSREGSLDLAVLPEARGSGLGARLAYAALTHTEVHSAWSHGDHPAARRLAAHWGFQRTRELWVMRRPSAVPLPDPAPRPGIHLRAYQPPDAPEIVRVNAAAFADHPEQGQMDQANLTARMAEPWFDPEGLLVAEDEVAHDGTILGFHWTKQHDARLGEVYVVAVEPEAQGRGLGKLVTWAGLRHLLDRGVAEVLLYVESDNQRAVATYTAFGFTHSHADAHVMYTRPL
jgi:mycothiol synthase